MMPDSCTHWRWANLYVRLKGKVCEIEYCTVCPQTRVGYCGSTQKEAKQLSRMITLSRHIYMSLKWRLDTISMVRRWLAVYRLYRYWDIPIPTLSLIFQTGEQAIRASIGKAFTALCSASDCALMPYMKREVSTRQRK